MNMKKTSSLNKLLAVANNMSVEDFNAKDAEHTKKLCVDEAQILFDALYRKIPSGHYAYLFTSDKKIYPFEVADENQRLAMAKKAVELSNQGVNVWHSVNVVKVKPADGKRGTAETVSFQTALVVDIDILGSAHKSKNLAADFNEAKSFLPFDSSFIVSSGYGLQAYYIFAEPIEITNDNRAEIKERARLSHEIICARAGDKDVDNVSDLPRVLRTPGTKNYKLGNDNAPTCSIRDGKNLRFSLADIDEKLQSAASVIPKPSKPARKSDNDSADDNPELKEFRIQRMLECINIDDGNYDMWIKVGIVLYNEFGGSNVGLALWENWSSTQPDYTPDKKGYSCSEKWSTFHDDTSGLKIGSLYRWAKGYDEKKTRKEFRQLHPEFFKAQSKRSSKHARADSRDDDLKAALRDVNKKLAEFDAEKTAALETLCNVETFGSDIVFKDEIMKAATFAFIFDKKAFSDFRNDVKNYGDKNRNKKVSIIDWLSAVKERAAEIKTRQDSLLARQNEIQAEIETQAFVGKYDALKDKNYPHGYSISETGGIVRIDGEKSIPVCRRPVVISGKTFSVDDKIYKLALSYLKTDGKWKSIPDVSAAVIANKNKIVDLAEIGLPVTSTTAKELVDFIDAYYALNENNLPLTYSVSRCGWHEIGGQEFFVDPRRKCVIDDDKAVKVEVDSARSAFANHLKQAGSFNEWAKLYRTIKEYSVARLMVAASVAPILLNILGERNILLYVQAKTRAGKTSALDFAASAVGDEKIIRSFDATKNGLAGAAADVNDYPFFIDEKQVADNRLKDTFKELIYALSNGVGRTKLNRDSTLKETKDWRTVVVMTGETELIPDNATGGAFTRLLSIKAPKEILPSEVCKTIHEVAPKNFGLVFPRVLEKIIELRATLGEEKLRDYYDTAIKSFTRDNSDWIDDHCRFLAVLSLADALLNVVVSGGEFLEALAKATDVFDKKILSLMPTKAEIDDTPRERDCILSFIAQNQNRFVGGTTTQETLGRMQAIYGKLRDDDGYTYITTQALKDACASAGFDYRKVVNDLIEDEFFIPADVVEKDCKSRRPTVIKRIAQLNARCYRIPNTRLDSVE